jgi:hypothetical protein
MNTRKKYVTKEGRQHVRSFLAATCVMLPWQKGRHIERQSLTSFEHYWVVYQMWCVLFEVPRMLDRAQFRATLPACLHRLRHFTGAGGYLGFVNIIIMPPWQWTGLS